MVIEIGRYVIPNYFFQNILGEIHMYMFKFFYIPDTFPSNSGKKHQCNYFI